MSMCVGTTKGSSGAEPKPERTLIDRPKPDCSNLHPETYENWTCLCPGTKSVALLSPRRGRHLSSIESMGFQVLDLQLWLNASEFCRLGHLTDDLGLRFIVVVQMLGVDQYRQRNGLF